MPHTLTPAEYAAAVAAEVRAEMGRQRKTKAELAEALGVHPATAGRRLESNRFDTTEIARIALWLGVPVSHFYPTTEESA